MKIPMVWVTDSTTPPPPQNQRFCLTNVSWLLDTRKNAKRTTVFKYFFVCKGLSKNDVGVTMGTVFQEIRPGVGFKAGDFVKEYLGGATVERVKYTTRITPKKM